MSRNDPPDHKSKFCDFILDPLRSRPGGELHKCGRAADGWDHTTRGYRCRTHLSRKREHPWRGDTSLRRSSRPRRPSYAGGLTVTSIEEV